VTDNSSYTVHDYTTTGHGPLAVYMYCIHSIYTFLQNIHTFLYTIFIYYAIIETYVHSFCYGSFQYNSGSLATQKTLFVSGC